MEVSNEFLNKEIYLERSRIILRRAVGGVVTPDIIIKNKRVLLNLARVRINRGSFNVISTRDDIDTYLNGLDTVELCSMFGYLELVNKIGFPVLDGWLRRSYELQNISIDSSFIYTDYNSLAKLMEHNSIDSVEIETASLEELKLHICETPANICKSFNIPYEPSCIGMLIGNGFEDISIDI